MRSEAVSTLNHQRDSWLERILVADRLPESVLRFGLRRLLRRRLREESAGGAAAVLARKSWLVAELRRGPSRSTPRRPTRNTRSAHRILSPGARTAPQIQQQASLTAGAPNVYCRRRTFSLDNREEACDE